MRVLHSSDWHIGRSLFSKKRYEEFELFLNWLAQSLDEYKVDVLVIAGDVFDSTNPSHRAQELYYRFLCQVAESCCRHVVVVAGNHDSPSFLNAPKDLLKFLRVYVVGSSSENLADELLVLNSLDGEPKLIVCAVPYLRDRDIRTVDTGEKIEDKDQKLIDAIALHYHNIGLLAEQKQKELGLKIPILATGHLFAAGGKTSDGDGVRELYVGSLAHVSAGLFPTSFDYLALGHLHVPQTVAKQEHIRYSGSPLAMSFGEAKQQKSLCLIEFKEKEPKIQLLPVPVFQSLEQIKGDWNKISAKLLELGTLKSKAWLEIVYEGKNVSELKEGLEAALEGYDMEILRVQNKPLIDGVLEQSHKEESLDDLSEKDVFLRCLSANEIPEDQQAELLLTYQESLLSFFENDKKAF